MKFILFSLVLLFTFTTNGYCQQSWVIDTARGNQTVTEGDILGQNSMFTGTIDSVSNITFYGWNFSRKTLTEVFTDCTNITFIDCNLMNVEFPDSSEFKFINSNPKRRKRVGDKIIFDSGDGQRWEKTIGLSPDGKNEMVVSTEKKVTPANEDFSFIDSRKPAPASN